MRRLKLQKPLFKIFLILFFVVAIGGCFWFLINSLVVKKVVCDDSFTGVCLELEKALLGYPIYSLETRQLTDRLLQVNPEIKTANVKKNIKGDLILEFEERLALGVLQVSDHYYLFDEEFVVYKEVSSPLSYTVVELEDETEIFIGTRALPETAISALSLLLSASDSSIKFIRIKDLGNFLSVQSSEGVLIWFPLQRNLEDRQYADMISDLEKIITQSNLEKRSLSKVDFRYSKIVIE